MNERIEELKKQATRKAMWPGDPDAGDLDVEQFAKLIVRECIDIVEDGVLNCDGESDWFEGYVRGAGECLRKIKQRFEVE